MWENLDHVLYLWARLAFLDWFWSTLVLYILVNKETTVWEWKVESSIKDTSEVSFCFVFCVSPSWNQPCLLWAVAGLTNHRSSLQSLPRTQMVF